MATLRLIYRTSLVKLANFKNSAVIDRYFGDLGATRNVILLWS